jgi:putative membrane protein
MSGAGTLPIADTWGMHGDVGTGWWIVMVVGMAVFWGAVIVLGAWTVRTALDRGPSRRHESALEVLERRFAEGDISVDDYRQRRKLLAGSGDSGPESATDAGVEGKVANGGASPPGGDG